MIAVLINSAGIRLGHTQVSQDCRLIKCMGAHFVRTDESAMLPEGGVGAVFAGAELHVYDKLDVYDPTPNFSKRPEL